MKKFVKLILPSFGEVQAYGVKPSFFIYSSHLEVLDCAFHPFASLQTAVRCL
jgi:hypothetical protein